MSCVEYKYNMSLAMAKGNNSAASDYDIFLNISYFFNHIAVPIILIFGILGNFLNLVILTRKSLQNTMDLMEKSVHLGLVVLAVSDLMFCCVALPRSFVPAKFVYTSNESPFPLYYLAYYESVVSIFIMSSTWLTVVMAIGRYLAICHPLHARGFVDLQSTKAAITIVYVLSIAFNLPMFWRYSILVHPCAQQCSCSSIAVVSFFKYVSFRRYYFLVGAIVCVFIPVSILAFTNICLIKALIQSQRMRQMYRANQPSQNSSDRLTPTLIAIVVLFLVLTLPSHIVKLFRDVVIKPKSSGSDFSYHFHILGTEIANFLLASNFAVNFVIYCVMNVHFRKTLYKFFCCGKTGKDYFRSQAPTTNLVVTVSEPETDV